VVARGGDDKGNPLNVEHKTQDSMKYLLKEWPGHRIVSQKGGVVFFYIVEHIMKQEKSKFKKSQIILEYMVIFAIVVAAIAAVGFLSNIKGNFSDHQNKCVDVILEKE